jgi:hypothetical protein
MQRTGISAWYARSQGEDYEDHYVHHPHNAYLEMLLDSGVIGLLVALALYGYLLTAGLSLARDRRSPVFQSVGGIALSLILAQLVGSLTGQSLYPSEPTIGMWCAIGLLLRVSVQHSRGLVDSYHRKRNRRPVSSPDTRIWLGVTASAPDTRSVGQNAPWWKSGDKSLR